VRTHAPSPVLGDRARGAVFDRLDAHPAGKGRHAKADYTRGFDKPAARLEASAPTQQAAAPTEWTLRWMDPFEPGEPVHTWTGRAPSNATWYPALAAVAAAHGRVVFAVADGRDKGEIVDVAGSGATRRASLDHGMPNGTIVIDAHSGAPAVWVAEESRAVFVWGAGEAPRAIATYAEPVERDAMALGAPAHGSVPVLLLDASRVAVRRLALDSTQPIALFLDGWASIDVDSDLDACPKGTEGDLPIPAALGTPIQVDGEDFEGFEMTYLARGGPGTAACIAGFRTRLSKAGTSRSAEDKTSHLEYLVVPELAAGTGVEEGGTPHLRTVRCDP
jgi:hypothetical protein